MTEVARAVEAMEPAVTRDDLWELIVATADNGKQRACDARTESGESLEDLRDRARELIIAAPDGSATKHVLPWIWSSQTSGGQPMTSAGEQLGAELRLSRYARPRFSGLNGVVLAAYPGLAPRTDNEIVDTSTCRE